MKSIVLAITVSLGLVLAACGGSAAAPTPALVTPTPVPPTPTPTPVPPTPTPVPPTPTPSIVLENLIGLWRAAAPDIGGYLQLSADGTYRVALAVPWLETSPYDVGEFQLEGTSFIFTPSSKSRDCAGYDGSYQVELREPSRLQFVLQEDACQARALEQPGAWERIPPTLAPSSITLKDLVGIWQNVDDKQYLQLNEDGTYSVSSYISGLEEYPFEAGQFQLEGTTFTLITGDESRFCRGQRGSYQVELTEQGQLHFEPQEDACQIRISFQSGFFDQIPPTPTPSITEADLIGM